MQSKPKVTLTFPPSPHPTVVQGGISSQNSKFHISKTGCKGDKKNEEMESRKDLHHSFAWEACPMSTSVLCVLNYCGIVVQSWPRGGHTSYLHTHRHTHVLYGITFGFWKALQGHFDRSETWKSDSVTQPQAFTHHPQIILHLGLHSFIHMKLWAWEKRWMMTGRRWTGKKVEKEILRSMFLSLMTARRKERKGEGIFKKGRK